MFLRRLLLPLLAFALGLSPARAVNGYGLSGLAAAQPTQTEAQLHLSEVLNQQVPAFDFPKGDLVGTLSAISRAMGVPIICEPEVSGVISFQISGLTLKQLLTAACSNNGVFYYIHPDGYVVVCSMIERIYPIDFLAAERKVSTQNTVSMLSSTNSGGTNGSTGTTGAGAQASMMGATGGAGGSTSGLPGSQVSVTGKNDDSFWSEMETHLKDLVTDTKAIVRINRTAGVLYVKGGMRTHAAVQAYWRSVMSRVNRGVTVHVYVLDCRYKNGNQLGFDWSADPFSLRGVFNNSSGGVKIGAPMTPPSTGVATSGLNSTLNTISAVGGTQIAAPTFSGTVAVGKLKAFISALETQSTVKASTAPTVGLLNNRTSVVQVSDDKNFFSRTEDTIINDGSVSGGTVGGSTVTPITRRKYSIAQYSFGLFMPVTVQVSDAGIITLDLNPTLTDFAGVDVSQDGLLTAPQKTTHQFSTQVQLRSGEAYVMGGYMRSMEGTETRATPGLSKIPMLGRLFKNEAKVADRGELMVVVEAVLKDVPAAEPIEIYTPNPSEIVRPDLVMSLMAPKKAELAPAPTVTADAATEPGSASAEVAPAQPAKSTSMIIDVQP